MAQTAALHIPFDVLDIRVTALAVHALQSDYDYVRQNGVGDCAEFRKAQQKPDAAIGEALLAEAYLRAGDARRAREVLAQAQSDLSDDSPQVARLAVLRTAILATPDADAARRYAAEARRMANESGFRMAAYEIRLAEDERESASGEAAAQRDLAAVRDEAYSAGLFNLSERANDALRPAAVAMDRVDLESNRIRQ